MHDTIKPLGTHHPKIVLSPKKHRASNQINLILIFPRSSSAERKNGERRQVTRRVQPKALGCVTGGPPPRGTFLVGRKLPEIPSRTESTARSVRPVACIIIFCCVYVCVRVRTTAASSSSFVRQLGLLASKTYLAWLRTIRCDVAVSHGPTVARTERSGFVRWNDDDDGGGEKKKTLRPARTFRRTRRALIKSSWGKTAFLFCFFFILGIFYYFRFMCFFL